jgi:hypothetical protein
VNQRGLALLWQKKRFRRCHQQRWKRSEFAQLLEIPRKNVKFCQGSVIEVQKKVAELLGLPLAPSDDVP